MAKTIDINNPDKVVEAITQEPLPEVTVAPVATAEPADIYNQTGVEAQIDVVSRETAEALRQYPKHKIVIPQDRFNKHNPPVSHCVNGFVRYFQRGVDIWVDEPTINDLMAAGYAPTVKF